MRVRIIDAFTERTFAGNPAGVTGRAVTVLDGELQPPATAGRI